MVDDLKKVHERAIKRFKEVLDRERDAREEAILDIRFTQTNEGQWDDDAQSRRQNRPRYTINKVAGAIDQIIGNQRNNRIAIKLKPLGGGADSKKAEIRNGLIRNIEFSSNAQDSYDVGFDGALNGGYGGWRVITEYCDDDIFEQDIKIKPIHDAASSLWFDPSAIEYDKRDADWAFLTKDIPLSSFKSLFPKASTEDFKKLAISDSKGPWFKGENVRIAEYFEKEPIKRTLLLLSDSRVVYEDDVSDVLDELSLSGVEVVKTRQVNTYKIKRYLMNGAEILEKPKPLPGKYIPLVPVFGRTIWIEGVQYIRGLTRFAKDSQRIYNYTRSAIVETAALAPQDPYWMTKKQAAGNEAKLRRMNVDNDPVQFFNPDPESPGAPKRTGAPQIQSALIEAARAATEDIQATTSIYAPSLGDNPKDQSGKALQLQQQRGDTGSFIYVDNLAKSIKYTGEIINAMLPEVYDTERVIRVVDDEGNDDEVLINQTVTDAGTGREVVINDITSGKYSVQVDTGPAYSTVRQEAADLLIRLAEVSEIFGSITPDLIAKNLDLPGNEELVKRTRKVLISQGVIQPNDDELEEMQQEQMANAERIQQEQEEIARQKAILEAKEIASIDKDRAQAEKHLADAEQIRLRNRLAIY